MCQLSQLFDRKDTRHASVLVWMYNDTDLIMWSCSYICTTRRESLGNEGDFFFGIYCLSQQRYREYDAEGFLRIECVCLCVCACVWGTCCQYTRGAFLMAVHSLTFSQTSCRYMIFARWLQVNLARFLVIILPAAENIRSGTAEVADTVQTFLPKRTIHSTTEEAHLNSVRGFLCDGNACRRILHKAISSLAMSELDLLTGREEAEDAAASQSTDSPSLVK